MITIILGLLFVAVSFQSLLSVFQTQRVYQTLSKVRKKYAGSGYVSMASHKSGLSAGSVVVLAIDNKNRIISLYEMYGRSVFCRLQEKKDYLGQDIEDVIASLKDDSRKKALKKAVDLLEEKRSSLATA